jgi:hypothetical protein
VGAGALHASQVAGHQNPIALGEWLAALMATATPTMFGVATPNGTTSRLLRARDAFDVPVIVRQGSPLAPERRPARNRVDSASVPWPTADRVPPSGDYLVTTTWREVLDAALRMGRDPTRG